MPVQPRSMRVAKVPGALNLTAADLSPGDILSVATVAQPSAQTTLFQLSAYIGFGVNVIAYGAKGNGVDDDTDAVAAALATGKDIFFPDGTYLISRQLIVSAQGAFGSGPNAIIKASDDSFNLFLLSGSGCRVANLTFHGAATGETSTQVAVETDSAVVPSDFDISNCHFGGPDAAHSLNSGIYMQGFGESFFRIYGNHFENLIGFITSGYGIVMGAVSDGIISGNTFQGARGVSGRHAIYPGGGAARLVIANNVCDSFNLEAYTLNQQGMQPANDAISFIGNIARNCGADGTSQSSISVFGAAKNILIAENQIIDSVGSGIYADAAGRALNDITIQGNRITSPNYWGIFVQGALYQDIGNNVVSGASQKAPTTYGDIDVRSDGVTAPAQILVHGNQGIPDPGVSRCAFSVNNTSPVPLIVKCFANDFPSTGYASGPLYSTPSVLVWIEGRIQVLVASVDFPNTAAGASTAASTVSVPGAAVGDIVTVSHEQTPDGWINWGRVTATDMISYWGFNGTAGAVDPASGNLRIDVWKRDGAGL